MEKTKCLVPPKMGPQPNGFRFDCRKYVKPGDKIYFHSMWLCTSVDNVQRREPIPAHGIVVGVYEAFVRVKLRRVTECVNRWDIIDINGKHVHEGCFIGFPRVDEYGGRL